MSTPMIDSWNQVVTASPGEGSWNGSGNLPEELAGGIFYANGPGRLILGGQRIHPFDGHGYLRELRLSEKGIAARARFVQTPAYLSEEAAGKVTYRGIGTLIGGKPSLHHLVDNFRAFNRRRNVANTCVLPWSGKLLMLWEGGQPYALDPESLSTLGPMTFGGKLPEDWAFLAHTRVDAKNQTLVGLSVHMEPMNTRFVFREFDRGGNQKVENAASLRGASLIHDFVITPNYCLLFDNPMTVDPLAFVKARVGMGTLMDAVKQRQGNGRLLVVPRDGRPQRVVDLGEPLFVFHHANAWEEGDRLVIVTCAFSHYSFGQEFGYQGPEAPLGLGRAAAQRQKLLRIEVDLKSGGVHKEQLSDLAIDFPRVHPERDGQPVRYMIGGASSKEGKSVPFDSVAHVDLRDRVTTQWTAPEGCFVGEPLYVPRADKTDDEAAWILVLVYDAAVGQTRLTVLDRSEITQGPVASVALPVLFPYGFHGHFEPRASA